MAELATLQQRREHLTALRARGVRSTEIDGTKVSYATDAEMVAAIQDLDRQIAALTKPNPYARIVATFSKGF